MTSGFLDHPDCLAHDTGPSHPERASRQTAVRAHLERTGLLAELELDRPEPADENSILAVHGREYLQLVQREAQTASTRLDPDTVAGPGSERAARLASGGVLKAIARVRKGDWSNAFVACRPPGHHAEKDRAMGFCLFNHVAVGARYLIEHEGLERVAIVDWDVHHGNGTQHSFEKDSQVFYASLHQYPFYPGTGAANERGIGAGEGATLNLPMAEGSGDSKWMQAFENALLPALEAFDPQFLIISAGFDGHRDDPLAGLELSSQTYKEMTRGLVQLCEQRAIGLVSSLEGGYDLESLGNSACSHVEALLEAKPRTNSGQALHPHQPGS